MTRLPLHIALVALCFATIDAAGAHTACSPAGHTGEGFPAYTCSDGTTWYADLDGDGRDPATNGRWVETNPAWIVEEFGRDAPKESR